MFRQYIKQDILDTIAKDKKRILLTLKEKLAKLTNSMKK